MLGGSLALESFLFRVTQAGRGLVAPRAGHRRSARRHVADGRINLFRQLPLDKPPDALVERAREILADTDLTILPGLRLRPAGPP